MINLQQETLLTLADAATLIPGRPSANAIWRWRTKGVRGRKLESITIGGRVYTSHEALQRFAQQQGGNDVAAIRTPAKREKAIRKAEEELRNAGI